MPNHLAGALARRTAERQGAADARTLRDVAQTLEHETAYFWRYVTAERLRLLAERLEIELLTADGIYAVLVGEREDRKQERQELLREIARLRLELEAERDAGIEERPLAFTIVMKGELPPGGDIDALGCELAMEIALAIEESFADDEDEETDE